MKALLNPWIARLTASLRSLGPYAAIELLLPGGSVIALLIWLYRHRTRVIGEWIVPRQKATFYSMLMASNLVVRLIQQLNDADQLARTCGPALLVVCTEQLDWLPIRQLFCELFAVKRYGARPLTEPAANGHVDDLRQHRLPPFFRSCQGERRRSYRTRAESTTALDQRFLSLV